MIKYQLICDQAHDFEAWFTNSTTYDAQAQAGQVTCPHCGSTDVKKAMMAPNVATTKTRDKARISKLQPSQAVANTGGKDFEVVAKQATEAVETLRKLRKHVKDNADYVGSNFADEARKIHNNEAKERGIWGEATLPETKELLEDGINVVPMPELPEDKN